jgi:hypothetical protein
MKGSEADLARLRSHDQSKPATREVMNAAHRVFDGNDPVGCTEDEIRARLGEPRRKDGARWHYVFDDGELGVRRVFVFAGSRVIAVEVVMTQ